MPRYNAAMPANGAISSLKAIVPAPVKSSLRGARRALRDRIGIISNRLARPNLYRLNKPERVGVVYSAPSDMRIDERLFLYAMVRGFRPQRALEIGVLRGGSAAIITNALEEVGRGTLVGVDPEPAMAVPWRDLHGRYTLIRKPSPDAIPEARDAAGGPWEFVLIDGLHRYDQVRADLAAVLPHLSDGAYILFHDAFHYGVATAVREAVEASENLIDCGYPCRTVNPWADATMPYNGFRLLRYAATPARSVDVERILDPLYEMERRARPPLRREALNHDLWYCRAVGPCEQCRAQHKQP